MAAATHVPESRSWHNLETADVLEELTTPEAGLSVEEARRRLEIHGPNELQAFERGSAWHTLTAQFKNVLVVILLAATVLSGLLGHGLEAAVIAVIVLFAVLLGFIQEYRAERALEALRKMAAPLGHAIRGGVEVAVPARELVPGDLIVLRAGERVPADSRLTIGVNLSVDEAALTGESAAVDKSPVRLDSADLPLGDRRNMVIALAESGRLTTIPVEVAPLEDINEVYRRLKRGEIAGRAVIAPAA